MTIDSTAGPGPITLRLWRIVATCFAALALVAAGSARAQSDPPSRIARIAAQAGSVSIAPAGERDWFAVPANRPLAIGDRLWVGPGGRAELQTIDLVARIGAESLVTLLDFDDDTTQVQLSQGSIRIRLRSAGPGDVNEVATPQLAFAMMQPGDYRIDVEPSDGSTRVAVRSGRAEVSSEGTVYSIHAGRAYRFVGPGLRSYEEIPLPPVDSLDAWAAERELRYANAASAAIVPVGVLGYEELDQWGVWQSDPAYGSVWFPRAAPAGWSPYTAGHWAWISPWGWTWIDEAPWGFAVSHYGRWTRFDGRWGWVPGPRTARAVYAPALVAFIGGPGFQLTLSSGPTRAVGWYPLAPREVYRPWYPATHAYFSRVNLSNTAIAPYRIEALRDRRDHDDESHAHRRVPGALVVVPAGAFSRSEPVGSARVRLSERDLPAGRFTPGPEAVPPRPTERPALQPSPGPAPSLLDRPATTRHVAPARPSFQPDMRPTPGLQRPEVQRPVEAPRREARPSFEAPRQEPRPGLDAPDRAPRPSFDLPRREQPVQEPAPRVVPQASPPTTQRPERVPPVIEPRPIRPSFEPQPRSVEPSGPAILDRRPPAPVVLPPMPQAPAEPRPAPELRRVPEPRPSFEMRPAPEMRPSPELRPSPESRPAPAMRSAPEPRPTPEPRVAPEPRGMREPREQRPPPQPRERRD